MREITPIFIVGSARSGTTLLASMITRSEDVAVYRAETIIMVDCKRKYGPLKSAAAKKRFRSDWFRSRQFRRLGITQESGREFLQRANTYAELVRLTMNDLAVRQEKKYWLDSTPSNVFVLKEIFSEFPNARVINVVRDGRAVAASLRKLGWTAVNTNSSIGALEYSALKWQQSVEAFGKFTKASNQEMIGTSYERLIENTARELSSICDFIGIANVDVDDSEPSAQSAENGPRSLASNSAFGAITGGISQEPLTRWRKQLTKQEVSAVERIIGASLVGQGYALDGERDSTAFSVYFRSYYRKAVFGARELAKRFVRLRSLVTTPLEIDKD